MDLSASSAQPANQAIIHVLVCLYTKSNLALNLGHGSHNLGGRAVDLLGQFWTAVKNYMKSAEALEVISTLC